jgi:hypothetical protein
LLRERSGNQYVVLHLICQGLELLLKATLLLHDYDHYAACLRKPKVFGHDLMKLANESVKLYAKHDLSPATRAELATLHRLYSAHALRYGMLEDIFMDASTIPFHRVLRHTARLIRRLDSRLG